jgi:acylglycerol lipase
MKKGPLEEFLALCSTPFAAILLLTGCTYAGRPYLTSEEKAQARRKLVEWPTGQVVTYLANDRVNLRARFYRPENSIRAVVVALHRIETNSQWYAPLAKELTIKGIGVLAIDRRGSGLNAGIGGIGQMGPKETYDLWLQDISAAIKLAVNYRVPVYLLGNSWGGNPVLAWTDSIQAPQSFRGTILLTPGLASRKPTFWQQLTILLSPDSTLLGTCLSVKDYSQRRSTWALLEEDASLTHQVSARFFKQTRQMRQTALRELPELKTPILLILAGKDELMENEVMTTTLKKGVPPAFLKIVTLPNDYHLVLAERPREVALQIAAFVGATM